MAAEERVEPSREEREADADHDGRGGVPREMAREPVGCEAGRRKGEEDEQVVRGMEAEGREQREGQGQREKGLRQVPPRAVYPELVGVGEERGRADEPVLDEPELVVELERVRRDPRENRKLGELELRPPAARA